MNNIKICEYKDKYAESIAEMWNKSSENWGGYDHLITVDTVRDEHKNTDFINTYLAIDKKTKSVVGYCGFSEYRNDEGALYIPILNVRPDYQGKKIGKALVLKTVERTIELDWPRLDLYTWSGNTKAVPLYKKCGFFWEKRDDNVHLMNFIPTVLKTEALTDYFEEIDWYEDSLREIDLIEDGKEENDYNHYEYIWKLSNDKLCVGFERLSRGIRKIETPDYLIETMIDDYSLVYENKYKIRYKIINKNNKDLKIKISGESNKNIDFDYEQQAKVKDEKIFEGEFYINKAEDNISIDKTHPAVKANIEINGKKVVFKQGIKAKKPLEINLNVPVGRKFDKSKNKLYIEIKNNYKEKIDFSFDLPSTSEIIFSKNKFELSMNGEGKAVIPLDYYLVKSSYYKKKLEGKVVLKENDNMLEDKFDFKVSAVFRGAKSKFALRIDEGWILANGPYAVLLNKNNNQLSYLDLNEEDKELGFIHPRIGLPFSHEFSKKEADKVEFYEVEDCYCMRVIFESEEYSNLHLISVIKLKSDGLVENYYELYNLGEKNYKDLNFSHSFYFDLNNTYLPYKNKVIKNEGYDSTDFDYWNNLDITENWLYSIDKNGNSRAVIWPEDKKLNYNGWYMSIDFDIDEIKENDCYKTDSLYLSIDNFKNWNELRKFALKDKYNENIKKENDFHYEINNDNPFVENNFQIDFRENKNKKMNGKIDIFSEKEKIKKQIKLKDEKEKIVDLKIKDDFDKEILKINFNFRSEFFSESDLIYAKKDAKKVKGIELKEEGKKVYEINNGKIKYRISPDFSPYLYSLKYKNKEWLDSSFPKKGPKSWWNPWAGGVILRPEKVRSSSLLEEKNKADFVKIRDNKGNQWQGIKSEVKIQKNNDYKNTILSHYYLTMAELPLICSVAKIKQNTDKYFNKEKFTREFFFKLGDQLTNSYFEMINNDGKKKRFKGGYSSRKSISKQTIFYGSKEKEEKLQVYQGNFDNYIAYTDLEVITSRIINNVSLKDGEEIYLPPIFLIFTDKYISENLLKSLSNIKFN